MNTIEAIIKITKEKRDNNIFPEHPLMCEICKLVPPFIVNLEIEELLENEIVEMGDTINDKYVRLR